LQRYFPYPASRRIGIINIWMAYTGIMRQHMRIGIATITGTAQATTTINLWKAICNWPRQPALPPHIPPLRCTVAILPCSASMSLMPGLTEQVLAHGNYRMTTSRAAIDDSSGMLPISPRPSPSEHCFFGFVLFIAGACTARVPHDQHCKETIR
jgi:hypothetical protein